MPTRKRNDDEQKLYETIEALKVQRRAKVTLKDAAYADLMSLTSTHPMTELARAAKMFLERVESIKSTDKTIETEKARYDELRKSNDARN